MGDDAPHESQYAQVTPRTAEMRRLVGELVRKEIEAERDRAQQRIDEIMASAGQPAPPPPPPRRKPKRERPDWLRVIPGGMAAFAPAAFLRAHARHVVIGTAAAALVTGGTLTSTDLMQPAPAALVPGMHAVAHHHHRGVLPVLPAATLPKRRRRNDHDADDVVMRAGKVTPAPSPAPTGTAPAPEPSPMVTTPDPLPSVTIPPPTPDPVPTCTDLTGKHCHPGDGGADHVLGALRGLTG